MYPKVYNSREGTGEDKIIAQFLDTIAQHGLSYITDIGYREFFDSGESFGICSNQFWKQKKNDKYYTQLISDFYANELLRAKRQQHRSSIRVQGQEHNRFLKEIGNYGMGNVLVIFQFYPEKIKAYYFIANGKNYNAPNYFCNDNIVFHQIVKSIEPEIDLIVQRHSFAAQAVQLFTAPVIDELFNKSKTRNLVDCNSSNIFTLRQTEILQLLADGCTRSKSIARNINVCPRTAEWHLQTLRKKTNLPTKAALIEYAKELIAS